ncbi:MAG: tRNA (adenosine(37)-N6)-threonylcarbamoyltransferase complex dimerization subunit type 1 TsaB [Pseudomonadota bacterium]
MTKILAIETSSEQASCALLNGDTVLARQSTGVRTHSQSILPMVQELLAEAGLALKELDAIAFGAGPGSFTGVRTACGIAQGLAFGAGLPVIPIVTLAAMALACRQRTGATDVLTVLDARMGEVYWAQYRFADGWQTVAEPALCTPGGVAAAGTPTACGNGLTGSGLADVMPHAAQVAELAALEFAAGRTVTAAQAQPIYLRNKIAYTSAERQVINAAKASA